MNARPIIGNAARNETLVALTRYLATTTSHGRALDLLISVGDGSGERFQPHLTLTNGNPHLAHGVVRGELDFAFVNPSALLTQAYRGTGLFPEPLPVRVVAVFPSWDRFVFALHERTGLSSLAEVKERRYPLRLSIREDPTHSTRVLIDQLLKLYDFTLDDLTAWGGSLQMVRPPFDARRLNALRAGELDAVLDEGIPTWLHLGLANGMRVVRFEEEILVKLEQLGWRRAVVPAGRVRNLAEDCLGLDYGGWPLYTRESMPDEDVERVCAAFQARAEEIPWEEGAFTGLDQLWRDTEATPLDVPLHPAAARWARAQGYLPG